MLIKKNIYVWNFDSIAWDMREEKGVAEAACVALRVLFGTFIHS